jgi:hypothetical protein
MMIKEIVILNENSKSKIKGGKGIIIIAIMAITKITEP